MGKPLSASERRGLLWVAGAALLVILAGILTSRCDSYSGRPAPEEETIVRTPVDSSSSPAPEKKRRKGSLSRKRVGRKSANKTTPKEYRRRDPRHEPVDSILP